MNFLTDFVEQLVYAAFEHHVMEAYTNTSDGPERVCAMDPQSGIIFGAFVAPGETVKINRAFRAKIEPLDRVRIKPLCCVSSTWMTM